MSIYKGTQRISGVQTVVDKSERIGQIIQSTIPLVDAGLHLLDGALIQSGGIYSDFVDYIAGLDLTADYFCSEADWQTSVTNYGVCGKFVYDSVNNTVRLPKITGFTEGTITPTELGDLTEAGLPNITGSIGFSGIDPNTWSGSANGAFTKTNFSHAGNGHNGNANNAGLTFDFNASSSNSIYGRSNTVQPQSIKVLYYIVIATSTKTDIQVDIDEIATDLNGKADVDLSNVPASKGILTESYINGTSWYRVYSDGWCEQGGQASSGASSVTLLKAFTNTNYYVTAHTITNDLGATFHSIIGTKYTNSFTIASGQYGNDPRSLQFAASWQACGYIN